MQLVDVLEAELLWQSEPKYVEVKEGKAYVLGFLQGVEDCRVEGESERETLTGTQRNHLSQSSSCLNELAFPFTQIKQKEKCLGHPFKSIHITSGINKH